MTCRRKHPARARQQPLGLTIGKPWFNDGLAGRSRVLCRKPVAVRMMTDRPMPAHEKAVRGSRERNGRAAA